MRTTAKHSIGRIAAIGIRLIGDDRTGANYQFPPLVGQLMLARVNWPRNLLLLMDAFGVSPNALVHLANALNALLVEFSTLVGIERDWIWGEIVCLNGMKNGGPDDEKIIAKLSALDKVSRPLEKLRKQGEKFLLGTGGGDNRGAVTIVGAALDAIRSAADSAAKKSKDNGPDKDAVPALVGAEKGRDSLAVKVMNDHKFEISQQKKPGCLTPLSLSDFLKMNCDLADTIESTLARFAAWLNGLQGLISNLREVCEPLVSVLEAESSSLKEEGERTDEEDEKLEWVDELLSAVRRLSHEDEFRPVRPLDAAVKDAKSELKDPLKELREVSDCKPR